MAELPYRRLRVWQKANALAVDVVSMAETGAIAKRFYFRDQLCDAALSVAANIAEGNGRSTPLDYAAFLDRARASLFELDNWLYTAVQLNLLDAERRASYACDIEELSAMLLSLARRLRQSPNLQSRSNPRR